MELKHKKELQLPFYSLVHIAGLPGSSINSHKAGYLSPDGEFFPCSIYTHVKTLEHHFQTLMPDFFKACQDNNIQLDVYTSPFEQLFMTELGYIKISAIVDTSLAVLNSDELHYIWNYQWIYPLTEKQIEFLFPV